MVSLKSGGMAKGQSAMEYLITYGWAIMIIAVALSAIYALGFLNPSVFASQQCLLQAGFSCTVVSMATNGLITLNIYQTLPSQVNITAISCNSNSTFSHAYTYATANQIAMQTGRNSTLTLPCWSGSSRFSSQLGSAFIGYVLVNYTEPFVVGFPHTVSGKVLAKASYVGTP
jgi:hypothetical protein